MRPHSCYKERHSSALNKISARLPQALEFITDFDISRSMSQNVQKAYMNRWYGNVSEQKCFELTRHFKKRFVITPENFKSLQLYIQKTAGEEFAWLNHFYMLLDDPYYRWATAVFMHERYQNGLIEIPRSRFDQELKKHLPKTVNHGSRARYARNILTAMRDNGLLEGKVKKSIASPALPVNTMAYMLYTLSDFGVGANAFDMSPLFLSLLKTRYLLVPVFNKGEQLDYWNFTGDHEKITLNLNQPDLKNWLEVCI